MRELSAKIMMQSFICVGHCSCLSGHLHIQVRFPWRRAWHGDAGAQDWLGIGELSGEECEQHGDRGRSQAGMWSQLQVPSAGPYRGLWREECHSVSPTCRPRGWRGVRFSREWFSGKSGSWEPLAINTHSSWRWVWPVQGSGRDSWVLYTSSNLFLDEGMVLWS